MADRDERRRRFEVVYAAHRGPILGYVLRRTDNPDDAADVIAETFLTAWRRLEDMPRDPQARLWLYGVARRGVAQPHPGGGRRGALADRAPAAPAGRRPETARPQRLGRARPRGDRGRPRLLTQRRAAAAVPRPQAPRRGTGRGPPIVRHPRSERRPCMNQISRICPVTDAEAERIAGRGALADLAGQITTVPATGETRVGAPPHTGERRAGGRRRRRLLAAGRE